MASKYETRLCQLHFIADTIAILSCWFASYLIRFKVMPEGQADLEILFLRLSLLITALTLYFLHKNSLYTPRMLGGSLGKEIIDLIRANLWAMITFIILLYFFEGTIVSRITIIMHGTLSTIGLITVRTILRRHLSNLQNRNPSSQSVLLVGNGDNIMEYIKIANTYNDSGVEYVGWLDSGGLAEKYGIESLSGEYRDIRSRIAPDIVILSYKGTDNDKQTKFLNTYYDEVVPIKLLSHIPHSLIGHQIEEFGGIPLISINTPPLNETDMIIKRTLDLTCSALGLLVLSPLMIAISIAIKLSSKGSVFYGQDRVGISGKPFTMWKFRTMEQASGKEDSTEWSSKDSTRKTKLGSFLRKSSVDELPQLWNVLKGDMSLIGPRPERPFFVDKFKHEIPNYMLRHKMKAGITGWAQIHGWRGDTSIQKRIEYDIYYIKNWSIWLDIKIIFLTILRGSFNKNAY